MVGGFGGGPGGILRLLELLDEFGEAIAADILRFGARFHQIGSELFSWADLSAYVKTVGPGSHLWRAINGETYSWELRVMSAINETLRWANWQRSKPGSQRPKPIQWPWVPKDSDTNTYGTAAPVTDIRDFLMYRNGRAPATKD